MDSIPNSKSAPEVIILDDPYTDRELSPEGRERLRDWYTRDLPFGFVRSHL